MACKVKTHKKSRFLLFRLFWSGMRFWEGTKLVDTPENRKLAEAKATIISQEMKDGTFDYLRHFPAGNKRHLFIREEQKTVSHETVEAYYERWIPKQKGRVRPHRLKDYESQFTKHILPTRIDGVVFGRIPLSTLTTDHIGKLQSALSAKSQENGSAYKANSINSFIGGTLRAMLKDARRSGALKANLFDRDLFDPLPQTDTEDSIDPYTPEERELIIEGFRLKRPQFFAFVYHQFWTGCRPSETYYLRRRHVDLRYGWERIEGSRVERSEDGTKTVRSNRQIQLSGHLVDVLSDHLSFDVSAEWIKPDAPGPDDYVFTTPDAAHRSTRTIFINGNGCRCCAGRRSARGRSTTRATPMRASCFRPDTTPCFVSQQTGDSIKTLQKNYAQVSTRRRHRGAILVEAAIKESAEQCGIALRRN